MAPPVPANGRHSRRGRPFANGNPGRKPGTKNVATRIAASLLANEAEGLMRTAIELALAGDKDMIKFLLGRILPKERAVPLELPAVDSAVEAVNALAVVTTAVSTGEITPSEGAAFGSLIGSACARSRPPSLKQRPTSWNRCSKTERSDAEQLRRLARLEKLVEPYRQRRKEKDKAAQKLLVTVARDHAITLAALLLHGEPQLKEPLEVAFQRCLDKFPAGYLSYISRSAMFPQGRAWSSDQF